MADRVRVAFDCAPLAPPRTGIGNVTYELISRLATDDRLTLSGWCLGLRHRDAAFAALPHGVTTLRRPVPARPTRQAWLRAGAPSFERLHGPADVVHGTNYVVPPTSNAAALVTVHDMVTALHPEVVQASSRLFPALVGAAIERGAWVQVASNTVADEVLDAWPAAHGRLTVIPNGVTPVPPADLAAGHALAGATDYILALGTVEPRKRLPDLVAAFDRIAGDHPKLLLVIAGGTGWGGDALAAAIDASPNADRIRRIGWVDNPAALLRGATVLAFCPLYEGFGLPPLEAMTAGVPVVATRAGAVPEMCGDAALLVDVGDVDALAGAISRVAADEALAAELVAAGTSRVAAFDWDVAADEHAKLYRHLAGADQEDQS